MGLVHHFRLKGIHAVGTIRLNCLQGCPLDANKDLMRNGRSTIDYCCDRNSGIMAKKWVNYSVVNLASNYVGVGQIGELERWCGKEKAREIVKRYNKSMGGVRTDGHVAIIVINVAQDKALVLKDILAYHWYGKDQCVNPIQSSLSSEWKTP